MMISRGLVVEADPDDLALLQWLQSVVQEFAGSRITDPDVISKLAGALQKTERKLKSNCYRVMTSKAKIARREESRVAMRRALAIVRDRSALDPLFAIANDTLLVAPNARYVCVPALGVEGYALTQKGQRVRRSLELRLVRFGNVPFMTFLSRFEKTEEKMRAFASNVSFLYNAIVLPKQKTREQVVVGLLKSGLPAASAQHHYLEALKATTPAGFAADADAAVTCTRNAVTFGSIGNAAAQLRQARGALLHAGFPNTPVVMSAAKSLLAFNPPSAGISRLLELNHGLYQRFGSGEHVYKWSSRLMPASGTPAEVLRRVVLAHTLLGQTSGLAAVALASMAQTESALPDLVTRYREIEHELVRKNLSPPSLAGDDAIECIACAGTPLEVADTVATLAAQIAQGRSPERSDLVVAIAFAKRFAY
ncbi:MAG: hypothetical protein FWD69_06675 [Polyangiaceae bacterium]|nr:hypothetical protein [Polyangiaceae bacterium]